ncbi:MAG: EAL domain-containing protein [Nocardioides sp.]|uniref:EAL domain-containing protein n=1 Tax=Nocardioides sp. TaxID=35761 RepID=UPI0039E70199
MPGRGEDLRERPATHPLAGTLLVALGFTLLFALTMYAGRQTHPPGSPLAIAWPAAAVTLVWFLAVRDLRGRLVGLLAICLVSGAINQADGLDPLGSWLFGPVNASPGLVGAALLRRTGRWSRARPVRSLADLGDLAVASCAGAAVSAVAGGLVAWARFGEGLMDGVGLIGFRNALSIFVVAAAMLALPRAPQELRRQSLVGYGLIALTLASSAALMAMPWGLTFVLIPPLLLVAVRCGPDLTSILVSLQGVIVIAATTSGHGPFASVTPVGSRVLLAQLFILVLALVGTVMSVIEQARAQLYTPELQREAERSAELLPELERAARAGQFTAHFQPVVDLASGAVIAHEALVRWNHPTRGVLAPGAFLDVLESSGLIHQVGHDVLLQACSAAAADLAAGRRAAIHVNVSAPELSRPGLADRVATVLAESGLPPELLVLEITETRIVTVDDTMLRELLTLRAFGVQLAVDDFGTGFSSLTHLVNLPISMIKLDRSFVAELSTSATARTVSSAVRAMAAGLQVDLVAEGVETAEQAGVLRELGYVHAQGYLTGRPAPGLRANGSDPVPARAPEDHL